MHRVELKDRDVERELKKAMVPNAPCGVESNVFFSGFSSKSGFLMHRVELKVNLQQLLEGPVLFVPNAPCGVESF